ncbi:DHH family phosphoesterase [Salinirarus marinus]|uniref:DHH family phosphoesterase n=1 Tax=Salinirarus marinus TaxID=3068310 RepID=UPI003C6C34DE
MVSRLVLGCGSVGRRVVESLSTRGESPRAVVADESQAETLREAGVEATVGDPADPAAYPEMDVDVVLVFGDDAATNRRAAARARDRFPAAYLAAFVDRNADDADRRAIRDVADDVVDARSLLTDHVTGVATGHAATRIHHLLRVLRSIDGSLAVVMHDNPDPDAIASAIALVRIARTVGVDADPCYFGDISHQENRALVNLLDLNLRNVTSPDDLAEYGGIALVDHSRPGVNDGLDEDTDVDVVVDHHPPRAPIEARYVDLRSEAGATSTLLTEHLKRLAIEPDEQLATALLYGIRIDTRNFTREAGEADFEAAAFLVPYVDTEILEKVESPSTSAEVVETLARAIRNRRVRDDVLATGVGAIRNRDALAQAAEHLLNMEGIRITLVYGFMEGTVYASARARGADVDLGETLRDALGSIGNAGGHADMAGAQIPLGILSNVGDQADESLASVVDDVVAQRFFEALETAPRPPVSTEEIAFEFPFDERS